MSKRLFDIVCAALGLLLLAPLLVVLAVWIKLDSPGPVMFRQERVGRFGRPFLIHKFRTMRVDNAGLQITVGADHRITRAGAWLRRSKLDELPQLWDVLRGAMSLVGPRPEVPRYVALYPAELRELVPWQVAPSWMEEFLAKATSDAPLKHGQMQTLLKGCSRVSDQK